MKRFIKVLSAVIVITFRKHRRL